MESVQQNVAVKRVRRKTVSTSGAKRGRPPFVHFKDGRGSHWRIYFRLPDGITEIPKQLVVTSQGDQHRLSFKQDSVDIAAEVVAQLIISTDVVEQLATSGTLDGGDSPYAGHCSVSEIEIQQGMTHEEADARDVAERDDAEFQRYPSGLLL